MSYHPVTAADMTPVAVHTVWQEIFGGQKFCGFLKIALVSKFRVFVEF